MTAMEFLLTVLAVVIVSYPVVFALFVANMVKQQSALAWLRISMMILMASTIVSAMFRGLGFLS